MNIKNNFTVEQLSRYKNNPFKLQIMYKHVTPQKIRQEEFMKVYLLFKNLFVIKDFWLHKSFSCFNSFNNHPLKTQNSNFLLTTSVKSE